MSRLSSIPILFVVECVFLLLAANLAENRRRHSARIRNAVLLIIVSLLIWGVVSAYLALSGIYAAPSFLALLPGLWLPIIPLSIVGFVLLLFPFTRSSFHQIALAIPPHWWVGIQSLRMFTLGTLLKTIVGEFPVHVELAIGLTDLVFGVSAMFLYPLAQTRRISTDALALWHIVGVLIVIVPGELAIQTGLPGRLQIFSTSPTAEVMLAFPMVLAPTLVVPIFLMLNMLGAYAALLAKGRLNKTPTA